MSTDYRLKAVVRSEQGTGASRRLRKAGFVPAVVYGAGKDPMMISVEHREIIRHSMDEGFYSQLIRLDYGNKAEKVILRDLQRHVYKPFITHADFQRVKMDEVIQVSVQLQVTGEDTAPGIKAGGILTGAITSVEIECLPGDMPESIEIDVSGLEIGDVIRLTDITVPANVRLVGLMHYDELDEEEQAEQNSVLVSIQPPQMEKPEETTDDDIAESDAEQNNDEEGDAG
ncbi:MAG: 50S ribosomal protein L25/general stress protein Ctc [Thiotrichales bacterium]|nr:MAG: 50S ribosomal protein L25/general stress protein Ctc [Thiotrichales bacterium]